jgi:glycine hydroxymethyltransferase
MTTRGFGTEEARQIAHLTADVLEAPQDDTVVVRVAGEITALCGRFPVYGPQYRP